MRAPLCGVSVLGLINTRNCCGVKFRDPTHWLQVISPPGASHSPTGLFPDPSVCCLSSSRPWRTGPPPILSCQRQWPRGLCKICSCLTWTSRLPGIFLLSPHSPWWPSQPFQCSVNLQFHAQPLPSYVLFPADDLAIMDKLGEGCCLFFPLALQVGLLLDLSCFTFFFLTVGEGCLSLSKNHLLHCHPLPRLNTYARVSFFKH